MRSSAHGEGTAARCEGMGQPRLGEQDSPAQMWGCCRGQEALQQPRSWGLRESEDQTLGQPV